MAHTETQGTTLMWNSVSVGMVKNLTFDDGVTDEIPCTTFEDLFIITRPGVLNLGKITFDLVMNPDKSVQVSLRADRASKIVRSIVLVAPSGTVDTLTCSQAQVINFSLDSEKNGLWTAQLTINPRTQFVRT